MLRLFIKDNTNGEIHEYGDSCHDALILQEDGSLHYENLGNCTGTMFPEEGYSFCLADGTSPPFNDPEQDPYLDIGGEYYTQPKTKADRIRAMDDEELTTFLNKIVVCHHLRNEGHCEKCPIHKAKPCDTEGILAWLQQPADGGESR